MAIKNLRKVSLVVAGATLGILTVISANPSKAEQYKFTVENKTKLAISQVLVSEDGKSWGYFSLDSNIAPGEEGEMTWGENTNHEACVQWIKVGFEDGSVSDSEKFDFCSNPALVID